ncbi:MAG: M28 family peptidase [Planctomycetes bacterium]|nr:M28 family peptidase [Planctomycetota bacterium]
MVRATKKMVLFALTGSTVIVAASCAAYLSGQGATAQRGRGKELKLEDILVNGERTHRYLREICDIGPRPSGSEGMKRQQEYLEKKFRELGGQVSLQHFVARHPLDGSAVNMANMLVQWHPQSKERVLLVAHYDTRPFPDRDRRRPKGRFVGANDGASGVSVLLELGHHIPSSKTKLGVDFLLVDGEEFVFNDRDQYFLGSEHFASTYVVEPPPYRYRWGVVLDMIGDSQLQILQEQNSLRWSDTRPLVDQIWKLARELGVHEFIHRTGHEVRDDHLALHDIAKIPTCDIIDFDYPRSGAASYWHTEADLPDKCSALSLAKVGWVMLEWVRRVQ